MSPSASSATRLDQENDATSAAQVAIVNFAWPVAALAEVRRRLIAQGSGRILVMSSVAARSGYVAATTSTAARRPDSTACAADWPSRWTARACDSQILRSGVVRTRMTKGRDPEPFTTGPEEVAGYVMKGLATNDRVIWSPPILRYAFALLRHLPQQVWRKVSCALTRGGRRGAS